MSNHRDISLATVVCLAVTAVSVALIPPTYAQGQAKNPTKAKTPAKPKQIPGGANQVAGMNGKLGDMLFDGRWRFQVHEITEVSTYTLSVLSSEQDYAQYHSVAESDITTKTWKPKPGYTFIAIKCFAKNGQNSVQQLDFYSPGLKTALADMEGNSYPPIVFDMQSEGAWTTKKLLPGSSQKLTILFAVPPGTKPKDLVVSLKNWSDKKINNLRISLPAPEAPPAAEAPAPAP